jgi:thiol:disulfide interchange protein
MLRPLLLALCLTVPLFAQNETPATSTYTEVSTYDPSRSASDDIAAAQAEAKRTHKNVLLEFGGEWCSWCHIMDKTYAANPDLLALREQNYVHVKVNVSPENDNRALLKRFGGINTFPFLIVLDAEGKVTKKQRTGDLESGHGYDLKRFRKFLEKYAPKVEVL